MANGTLKVSNIQTSSGTGTITLGQSGETITVPSGVTMTGMGKVLQVVQTLKTDTFSTSGTNSFEDVTGMSVNITPTSASNKIFVMVNLGCVSTSTANTAHFRLLRDATVVGVGDTAGSRISSNAADFNDANDANVVSFNLLDSPSTTSQITYKIQIYPNAASYVNRMATDSDNDVYTRSSSTITVMEIGA